MYGGMGAGAATTGTGAAAIAVLPETGGSRSVVLTVAILSIAVGLAILITSTARLIAKRHYRA